MVRLLVIGVLTAFTAFLLAGCGGDSNSNGDGTSTTATRTPTRTASGPSATIAPRSGPPGTEVTVTGSGWPARAVVEVTAAAGGTPYASIPAADDGSFTARFRLEKQPDGSDLRVGPFNLIAHSGASDVPFSFQVETRRPLDGAGPGG